MANQEVPKDLMELAMQAQWFKNSRYKKGKGKGAGGTGLGFRDRPALGYDGDSSSKVSTAFVYVEIDISSKWQFQFAKKIVRIILSILFCLFFQRDKIIKP